MNTPLYNVLTDVQNMPAAVQKVQNFLGTATDPRWAIAVYRIALSNMQIAMLIDKAEIENLRGQLPIQDPFPAGYRLISDKGQYPSIKPAAARAASWPFSSIIELSYVRPDAVQLIYGGKTVAAQCNKHENVLSIAWPEDTGISGALECPTAPQQGMQVVIPVLLQYPVSTVVTAAKNVEHVITLLEHQNLIDDFYFGDSPEEKLAILVLAMYKEVYHARWK